MNTRLGIVLLAAAVVCLTITWGCSIPPDPEPYDFKLVLSPVTGGLTSPTAMAAPADGSGRLFVAVQDGRVRVVDSEGTLLETPFLDISEQVVPLSSSYDESGLLGITFHPDYKQNGRFFVFYNAPLTDEGFSGYHSLSRVSEFLVTQADSNAADPASEQIVLEIPNPQSNHNGGQLAFGPDGHLYIALGDGGGANDIGEGHTPETGNGQDPAGLLGTIVRLDVTQPGSPSVPADNPFVGNDDSIREEIYAYGFRNPWRFSFDAAGDERLFCGDVGQNLYEEIDIVEAGGNYGWNLREGSRCFNSADPDRPLDQCADTGALGEPLIDPVIEYPHSGGAGVQGRSVIGGFVYRGSTLSDISGYYIFGDWSQSFTTAGGQIFAAREDAGGAWQVHRVRVAIEGSPRAGFDRFLLSFGQDPDGELYVLTSRRLGPAGSTGEVYKITAAEQLNGN